MKRPPLSDPEHLDPRQRLAFQPFEEGAAGGRDIAEPPGRAGGIERRDRVAAACHSNNLPGGGEFRRGFGDFDRADVERFEFEGAERPVPDQRLDPSEHGADMLDAARADVQDHLIAAHAVHRDHARRRVGRERFGNHCVDRQYQLAAFGLRLGHDLARGRQEIALAQRFSHEMSARGQKSIGHAAADDERVDLCEQAAEQVELGRYLGSADIAASRKQAAVVQLLAKRGLAAKTESELARSPNPIEESWIVLVAGDPPAPAGQAAMTPLDAWEQTEKGVLRTREKDVGQIQRERERTKFIHRGEGGTLPRSAAEAKEAVKSYMERDFAKEHPKMKLK